MHSDMLEAKQIEVETALYEPASIADPGYGRGIDSNF